MARGIHHKEQTVVRDYPSVVCSDHRKELKEVGQGNLTHRKVRKTVVYSLLGVYADHRKAVLRRRMVTERERKGSDFAEVEHRRVMMNAVGEHRRVMMKTVVVEHRRVKLKTAVEHRMGQRSTAEMTVAGRNRSREHCAGNRTFL